MGFAKKMNTLNQELNRRQDATDIRMNQIDNRVTNSEQVVEKLSQDLRRALDKIEDDKAGNNDALCDELRERDLRKLNLVIHGVNEPGQRIGYNRDRIEADKRSCSEIFAAIGVRTNGGDLRFCRRIGERGRDARPIVIGLRTEEEKRLILERARALRGGRFDNVSVVPDLTRMQRGGEDRLSEEAARCNNNLTAEDRTKNLRWLVVGRRGEKRLIKGTETVQRERPPQPRLSDFVGINNGGRPPRPAPGGPGYQQHSGQTQHGGGNQSCSYSGQSHTGEQGGGAKTNIIEGRTTAMGCKMATGHNTALGRSMAAYITRRRAAVRPRAAKRQQATTQHWGAVRRSTATRRRTTVR
jgi:hypothetical protein